MGNQLSHPQTALIDCPCRQKKRTIFILASLTFLHSSHLHSVCWNLADNSVLLTWSSISAHSYFGIQKNQREVYFTLSRSPSGGFLAPSASHSAKGAISSSERQNNLFLSTKMSRIPHRCSKNLIKPKNVKLNYLLSLALELGGAGLGITYHLVTVWW